MLGTRTRLELENVVQQHQKARHALFEAQRRYRLNDVEPSEHDGPELAKVWPQRLALIALAAIVCTVFAAVMP